MRIPSLPKRFVVAAALVSRAFSSLQKSSE